ncbi:MAG: hypothetical protein VX281_01960 [Pseudomonadota bacterium]|nr:hypothetical protein [Pseudomonadota bacterium]
MLRAPGSLLQQLFTRTVIITSPDSEDIYPLYLTLEYLIDDLDACDSNRFFDADSGADTATGLMIDRQGNVRLLKPIPEHDIWIDRLSDDNAVFDIDNAMTLLTRPSSALPECRERLSKGGDWVTRRYYARRVIDRLFDLPETLITPSMAALLAKLNNHLPHPTPGQASGNR